jgi:glycosyltransferase involved in cell wall biosynthesis
LKKETPSTPIQTVGMVLTAQFPPDNRVYKEALSLIERGYSVYVFSLTFGQLPRYEVLDGIQIVRFHIPQGLNKKLLPIYLIFPLYRLIWYRKLNNYIRIHKIDVLHIHDLPLTDVGVALKKKYSLRLVADQHEYYSNRIKGHAHYNQGIGKLVNRLSRWDKYEKKYLNQADLILTVEPAMKKIYTDIIGLNEKQIVAVPNTPGRQEIRWFKEVVQTSPEKKKFFTVIYAGVVNIQRGLHQMVQALALLKDDFPDLRFQIVGRFYKNTGFFELAEELKVTDRIDFVGWKSSRELAGYLAKADIGISLGLHLELTIPTKIYQYLFAGLPMIVTDRKTMSDFVRNHDIGLVTETDNIEHLAQHIAELIENKSLRKNFRENTKKLHDIYQWDQTVKDMLNHYKKI